MRTLYSRYKQPLIVLALLVLGAGIVMFRQVKTGLFPDITFEKIKVIAEAGQQPVDRMLARVTIPLENVIKRTEGVDYIRSTTARGSCEISVFLKSGVDVDRARQQIESFVNDAQGSLPVGTDLSVQKMNPSILPIMGFSVEGPYTPVELKKIATTRIKPHLSAVRGVSDVVVTGGKTKEYHIILKPYKLSTLGISPTLIQTAVEQSNIFQSNGTISDHDRMYLTLTDNAVDDLHELNELVVQNTPSRLLRLRDVADVVVKEAKEYVRIKANGQDVPLIAIIKQPDANLLEVSTSMDEQLHNLSSVVPKGVHVVPFYRQSDFVEESIRSLRDVLWVGMLLAIVVVIWYLRSPSSSIVMLCSVPLTLSLSLLCMRAMGYTLNIMTLGAIAAALGLVIDDAVIVVEQIHRSREEEPDVPLGVLVGRVMHMLFPAIVSSSLSTVVIFAPFVLMSGVAGSYFKVMAFTMMMSLACSFVVSWIFLPSLFLLLPAGKIKVKIEKSSSGVWLDTVLRRPWWSLVIVAVCFVSVVVLPGRLPSDFLPKMDEGSIICDFTSPPGTTLDRTDDMLQKVDQIIQKCPEVQSYSRRLGTQMGFFITEPNYGDYFIQLKSQRSKTTEEVTNDIRQQVRAVVPQLKVDFGQVIGDMLGDLMTSVQPIELKVFGDDAARLQELSKSIAEQIREVPGTDDVFDGVVDAGPELSIQPDVPKLAQLGLSPSDFHFQLQTQIEGTVVGTVQEREQLINIRIIYPDALQTTMHSLNNASILLPNGMMKPISTVAHIEARAGVAEIKRENQKMMGVITARLDERDLGSTLREVRQRIAQNIQLPPGYHVEVGGSYAEQQKAFSELLLILCTALFLIFSVNLFLFRELKAALVVVVLAILGMGGSFLALLMSGVSLNVGSYMGIIMVAGVIAENAIFTMFLYRLARHSAPSEQSIRYAIAARLRPKLMTATCSIVALLPLALGIGTGAQLHQPLAISVIGGLIVALPLLLVVLPWVILRWSVLEPDETDPDSIEPDIESDLATMA